MRHKKWNFDFWTATTIVVLIIFLLFLMYPLLHLVFAAFQDAETGKWTVSNFAKFFQKRYYRNALLNSVKVTVCVTITSIILGFSLAYITSFFKIKGKRFIEICIILSMMYPAFIGAYSWILLLGRNGAVTVFFRRFGIETPTIYGFGGIVMVFTLKLYPFVYMYVSGALKKFDRSLLEAAEGLGAGRGVRIRTIVIPLLFPTVIASGLLVCVNSMADFGTPSLIGEGFRTMPVLIYSQFINEIGGNANFSSAMASIMILFTAVLFLLQRRYVTKHSFYMDPGRPIQKSELKGGKKAAAHIFLYMVTAVSLIPQITVIYTSFRNSNRMVFLEGYSFGNYKMVLQDSLSAIKNTYMIGLGAIAMVIICAILVSYLSVRRRNAVTGFLDMITMFPYIIPGSILGITLLLAFNKKPLLLSGTMLIMAISLAIRRLPYTLRSSSAILTQISPSLEEAATCFGSHPVLSFFRITLRLMLPGVFSGAIISWISILNELSSSVILYNARTVTLSVAVYQDVVRASYGTAAAMSTILTLTTAITLAIFFKVSGNDSLEM